MVQLNQLLVIEGRISSLFSFPYVCIYNIADIGTTHFRKLLSAIDVVRTELLIDLHITVKTGRYNNRYMFTSNIFNSCCMTSAWIGIVKFGCFCSWYIGMIFALEHIIHQFAGYWNFCFRSFTQ